MIETVVEAAVDWRIDDIKGLLGRCNFKADMFDRKVSLLSGGEKVVLCFYFFAFTIVLLFGVYFMTVSLLGTPCFLQVHGEAIHSTRVG